MLPSGEAAASLPSGEAAAADAGPPAPAVTAPVILTRRADFVAASRARRQSRPGLMLQARRRGPDETTGGSAAAVRIGFTCSKKVGNAVARNRAKRRLRAAVQAVLSGRARAGWDYVLIGRAGVTAARPFTDLCDDLASALDAIHGSPR